MRNLVDLEQALQRPPCPVCGLGRIRPTDISDGRHLSLECPIPRCRWLGQAVLPAITKKVIYLDTSTVSHMARALQRGGEASPWKALYERLRSAVASEVICCPGSAIVEREAELSRQSDEIVSLARQLRAPGLKHDLDIQQAQIFRALERFVAGEQASLEIAPPREDAFEEDVDRWLPVFNLYANMKTPTDWIESRRAAKVWLRDELERIFRDYERDNSSFNAICKNEAQGVGRGIIEARVRSVRILLGLERLRADEDPLGQFLPTTYDLVFHHLRETLGLSSRDAMEKTSEFLLSDHVKLTPFADIRSKLYAALAVLCRGTAPRLPRASDPYDVDHLAAHLPYVDILIADRFFAGLCNQNHLRLGNLYQCNIRALGPNDVPDLIAEIDRIVAGSPQAPLAERISEAIQEGGHHQEFAERAAAYLRARGVEPEDR